MTKPTVVAFVDLQIINGTQWRTSPNAEEKRDGWFEAISDHAEVHFVAIDGTFRQLFFCKDAVMRIVGNTVWFNAVETDYLITDHDKKFPNNKKNT